MLVEIGGDARLLRGRVGGDHAEARHQDDARVGVEGDDLPLLVRGFGLHVLRVVGLVGDEAFFDVRADGVGRHIFERHLAELEQERDALGADDVVGRGGASLGDRREVVALEVVGDGVTGAELEDDVAVAAEDAAEDRRQRRVVGRGLGRTRSGLRLLAGRVDELLGVVDGAHVSLVALLGRLSEGEESVTEQHQALGLRVGLGDLGGELGEVEAGHHVGDERQAIAEDLLTDGLRVRLVGQREHRVGVRVVDELRRQERVQQRLDARVGGSRVEQTRALCVHHVLVAQRGTASQRGQALEADSGQTGRLDVAEIPAAALHTEHVDLFTRVVLQARLHGCVPAAVEHQRRLVPDQVAGVDAEREVFVDRVLRLPVTARPLLDGRLGVLIRPFALHPRTLARPCLPGSRQWTTGDRL